MRPSIWLFCHTIRLKNELANINLEDLLSIHFNEGTFFHKLNDYNSMDN